MSDTLIGIGADAMVVFGLALMTLAVVGAQRLPDIYLKLHAAGKAASLGVAVLALATIATGQIGMIARAALVVAFVLFTAPVAAHAIARAAANRGEPMSRSDAIDESDFGLVPDAASDDAPDPGRG